MDENLKGFEGTVTIPLKDYERMRREKEELESKIKSIENENENFTSILSRLGAPINAIGPDTEIRCYQLSSPLDQIIYRVDVYIDKEALIRKGYLTY